MGADLALNFWALSHAHARGARSPVAGAHAKTHVAVTTAVSAVNNTRAHKCQGAQGPHRARDALRRRPARVQQSTCSFSLSSPPDRQRCRSERGGSASARAPSVMLVVKHARRRGRAAHRILRSACVMSSRLFLARRCVPSCGARAGRVSNQHQIDMIAQADSGSALQGQRCCDAANAACSAGPGGAAPRLCLPRLKP